MSSFSRNTFYDPLYKVIPFETQKSRRAGVNVRGDFWGPSDPGNNETGESSDAPKDGITPEELESIIDSFEFNRLNFLRQAGLTWLVYPSANYTRFSHALGCWVLSDSAADCVQVLTPNEELLPLAEKLKEYKAIEEFQLALLLHDIGHLPFAHVLENNDQLLSGYREYIYDEYEIELELDATQITRSLLKGDGHFSEMFREFTKLQACAGDASCKVENACFISERLKKLSDRVDIEAIVYLIDPDVEKIPDEINVKQGSHFIPTVKQLVAGGMSLHILDAYNRDVHFIPSGVGEFNVNSLLHHTVLIESNNELDLIVVDGDGINSVFQMLHAQVALANSVFHNRDCLAFEAMLNCAVNRYWELGKYGHEIDHNFRKYLPFLDDAGLLHTLSEYGDPIVKQLVMGIRQRNAYVCVGQFELSKKAYSNLNLESERSKDKQRQFVRDAFKREAKTVDADETECLLQFHRNFGETDFETFWLNPAGITAFNKDGTTEKSTLDKREDHKRFVEFINETHSSWMRTFWIFVKNKDPNLIRKGELIGAELKLTLEPEPTQGDE